MTQEELDALMADDVDLSELGESGEEEALVSDETSSKAEEESGENYDPEAYRVSADHKWPPPPPTDDHKVVNQLDDVTKDSEIKATQIFDRLEEVSNEMMNIESHANDVKAILDAQKELFMKLNEKFPNIEAFKTSIGSIEDASGKMESLINASLNAGDAVMVAMDIMQYQDIHRQKIERVINVMRALSKYMNSLFEGRVDDSKRVASATHIAGDTTTENVVSEDDIEALIASLGKK